MAPFRIVFVHTEDRSFADTQMFGIQFMPVWAYTLAAHLAALPDVEIELLDLRIESIAAARAADLFLFTGINQDYEAIGDLHALIASQGFIFISQPAFGDFVVSGRNYCGGVDLVQLRSVPTTDNPQCVVNYCVPQPEHFN